MSVSALSSQNFLQPYSAPNATGFQQLQGDLQQLGQALQSGSLPLAQQDFAALTQAFSSQQGSNGTTTQNPVASDFGILGQDLKSGNVAAAQQAYTSLQQDVQQAMIRPHHAHAGASNSSASAETGNPLLQAIGQIGQALKAGSTSAAQQAYTAIQGEMSEFAWGGSSSGASALATSGLNLLA